MDVPNPILWAAWAAFGVALVLVTLRILRAAIVTPAPNATGGASEPVTEPWLYCEEGDAVDREAQWFRLRPGARTVLGHKPRSATTDTTYIFLNAHDVADDHAVIRYDPGSARYLLQAPPGARLRHNNEDLNDGSEVSLTDGDTLDLGKLSRFRFTLSGPPEPRV